MIPALVPCWGSLVVNPGMFDMDPHLDQIEDPQSLTMAQIMNLVPGIDSQVGVASLLIACYETGRLVADFHRHEISDFTHYPTRWTLLQWARGVGGLDVDYAVQGIDGSGMAPTAARLALVVDDNERADVLEYLYSTDILAEQRHLRDDTPLANAVVYRWARAQARACQNRISQGHLVAALLGRDLVPHVMQRIPHPYTSL